MLKVLIVDDDEMCREILKDLIKNNYAAQVSKIFTAGNAKEAKKILKRETIGLAFLDIEMPHGNGFDLLSALDEINFFIVFVTAHPQYAIKAIKTGAIDYLMKPIRAAELAAVMKRIDSLIRKKQEEFLKFHRPKQSEGIAEMFDLHQNITNENNSIIIPHLNGVKIFFVKDIVRIEGDGNYSKIFDIGKKAFLTSKTLKYFEGKLEPSNAFYRVHKSALINLKHVKELHKENHSNYAKMADDSLVEISRRAYPGLLKKISSGK
jgi:two-component system, LytTR family, response regulator